MRGVVGNKRKTITKQAEMLLANILLAKGGYYGLQGTATALLIKTPFVKDIFAEKSKNHFWSHLHRDNNKIVIQSIIKNNRTLAVVLLFQYKMEINPD